MVQIFTTTKSIISSEFVESIPAEKLSLALLKIGQETGVEFSRQKKSYSIAGHWNAVIKAHERLELFYESVSFHGLSKGNKSSQGGENAGQKKSLPTEDGKPKKQNTAYKRSPESFCVPDPVVLYQYDKKSMISKDLLTPAKLLYAFDENNGSTSDETQRKLINELDMRTSNEKEYNPSDTNFWMNDGKAAGKTAENQCNNSEDHMNDSSADIDEADVTNDENGTKTESSVTSPKSGLLESTADVENNVSDEGSNIKKRSKRKSKPVRVIQSFFDEEPEHQLKKTPIKRKLHNRASAAKKTKRKTEKSKSVKGVGEFKCDICNYRGHKKENLADHKKRKHKDNFNCDDCEKQFGCNRDLNRHIREVHVKPAHFCDVCHKYYRTKRVYEEHILTHSENYVKPNYACKLCPKSFSTKYVLSTHIKAEHLGMKKSYICPTCGRSFTQKNSYIMHANVHAGIKPYVCDVCGKSFTYDKSLREHKLLHDSVRRFQCHVCSKTFRQTTSLRIHMKTHKENKDYMCTACGKGFSQKQALLRHERIHSGDKPYVCSLCGRSFSDYSIIRRHMMMIHKKETNNWREDIISMVKKKKDYYIEGGPGHYVRESKAAVENRIVRNSEPTVLPTNTNEVIKQSMIVGRSVEQSPGIDFQKSNVQDLSQTQFPSSYAGPSSVSQQVAPSVPLNYSTSAYNTNTSSASSVNDMHDSSLESYNRQLYSAPTNMPDVPSAVGLSPLRNQLTMPPVQGVPVSGDTSHAQLFHAWPYSSYGPYYSSSLP